MTIVCILLTLLLHITYSYPEDQASVRFCSFDAREATVQTVRDAIVFGDCTCRQIVSSFLTRIEHVNPQVNAIISLNPNALSVADDLDVYREQENTTWARLFCVPVLLKDNFDTMGMPTTGGSLALKDSRPSRDASTVAALIREGAVILGKTNLHEMALEGLTVSSLGGQTLNPYDLTRTPGGSSGGSGAAVAASLCVFATGTDTMNSLRSPASANGLVSIRPTRGVLSRAGVMPVSSTQDVVGPIARSIGDLAVAFEIMSTVGMDKGDDATLEVSSSERADVVRISHDKVTLKGLRLGVMNDFFDRRDTPETRPVNEVIDALLSRLRAEGVVLTPIPDGTFNPANIAKMDVQRYEFREFLNKYLADPSLEGIHPKTIEDMYSSTDFLITPHHYEYINTVLASSTENSSYPEAIENITGLKQKINATFEAYELDAIIYPEQMNLVVKVGSRSQTGRNGILAAVTGLPVVAMPAGFSEASQEAPVGIPIGVELLGQRLADGKLLQIAWQIERIMQTRRAPKLAEVTFEPKLHDAVPIVQPNRGNVPSVYPVGLR